MPKSSAQSASLYAVHPGIAMLQKWIIDLQKWLRAAYDLDA